jgi:hypothetical protein
VARQFAEFLKDVFKKLLGLVMTHGEPGDYIRLRGQWVPVDPSDWKNNYDMTVSVGLGSNNKDQLVGQLGQLLQTQAQIIEFQGGAQGPLVTLENVYHVLKKQQEAMGLKGDKYFTDPGAEQEGQAEQPPAQPEQDPNAGMAEAEMAKEDMRAKASLAREQIKKESAAEVADIRGQYDVAKAAASTGLLDPNMGAF